MMKLLKPLFGFILLCMSASVVAAGSITLEPGNATTINFSAEVATVFVSIPEVFDSKVINNNKIVIFALAEGVSAIIVYDHDGREIYNKSVNVVKKAVREIRAYAKDKDDE